MRVEWMQVAMEVVEQSAPDMAVLLETTEAEAGWGLIKLFKWALGRVPQGEYPSLHDTVPGPMAARLIARAAGYAGDPEAYITAAESLAHPILQRVSGGVRFRGMNRYDVLVDGAEERSAKAKKAAGARWAAEAERKAAEAMAAAESLKHAPSITQASVEHRASNAPRCQDGDKDGDGDREKPPPPPRLVVVGNSSSGAHELSDVERSVWERIQRGRDNFGLVREHFPPAKFSSFCNMLNAVGVVEAQLEHALTLFLRDKHFSDRNWPTAVFMQPGVFDSRLPEPPRGLVQ